MIVRLARDAVSARVIVDMLHALAKPHCRLSMGYRGYIGAAIRPVSPQSLPPRLVRTGARFLLFEP